MRNEGEREGGKGCEGGRSDMALCKNKQGTTVVGASSTATGAAGAMIKDGTTEVWDNNMKKS